MSGLRTHHIVMAAVASWSLSRLAANYYLW